MLVNHDSGNIVNHIEWTFNANANNAKSCDDASTYKGLEVFQTRKIYYEGKTEPVTIGPELTKNYNVSFSPELAYNATDNEKDITANITLTRQTGATETNIKTNTLTKTFKQAARSLTSWTNVGEKVEDKSKMEMTINPNPAIVNKDGETITFNAYIRKYFNQQQAIYDTCDNRVVQTKSVGDYEASITNPTGVVWSVELAGSKAKATFTDNKLKVEPNTSQETYTFNVKASYDGKTITIPVTQGKQRSTINKTYSLSATSANEVSACYTTDKVKIKVYEKYIETYDDGSSYESNWVETTAYNFTYSPVDWTSYKGESNRNIGINVTGDRTNISNCMPKLTTITAKTSFTQKGITWGQWANIDSSKNITGRTLTISTNDETTIPNDGGNITFTASSTEYYTIERERVAVGCSTLVDKQVVVNDYYTINVNDKAIWSLSNPQNANASMNGNVLNVGNNSTTSNKSMTVSALYNGAISNNIRVSQEGKAYITDKNWYMDVSMSSESSPCYSQNDLNLVVKVGNNYTYNNGIYHTTQPTPVTDYTVTYSPSNWESYEGTSDRQVNVTVKVIRKKIVDGVESNQELTQTRSFTQKGVKWGPWVDMADARVIDNSYLKLTPTNDNNIDKTGGTKTYTAKLYNHYKKSQQRRAVGCDRIIDTHLNTVDGGTETVDVTNQTNWKVESSTLNNITNNNNGSFTLTKNTNQIVNTYKISAICKYKVDNNVMPYYITVNSDATFKQDAGCIVTSTTYKLSATPKNASVGACAKGNTFDVYETVTTKYSNCPDVVSGPRLMNANEYNIAYNVDMSTPNLSLTNDQNITATITSKAHNGVNTTASFKRGHISESDLKEAATTEETPYMYSDLTINGDSSAYSCASGTEQFTAMAYPHYKTKLQKVYTCDGKSYNVGNSTTGKPIKGTSKVNITKLCDWTVEDVIPDTPIPSPYVFEGTYCDSSTGSVQQSNNIEISIDLRGGGTYEVDMTSTKDGGRIPWHISINHLPNIVSYHSDMDSIFIDTLNEPDMHNPNTSKSGYLTLLQDESLKKVIINVRI